MNEQEAQQKVEESLEKTGLREKWFAKDNFIFVFTGEGINESGKLPIIMCNSNIIALHIACAHNAILESAP